LGALRLGLAERGQIADQAGGVGDFDAQTPGAVANIRQR